MVYRSHVLICNGTGCTASKAPELMARLEKELAAKGIEKEVKIVKPRVLVL